MESTADLKNFEVVRLVTDLAWKQLEPVLVQLASSMSYAIRLNHGADVLAKITGMISDLNELLHICAFGRLMIAQKIAIFVSFVNIVITLHSVAD